MCIAQRPNQFLEQQLLQDAILMRLHQIGENLVRIRDLDEEAFQHAPDSWHRLIGLRNVISHEYEKVKPRLIWRIVDQELPRFRATIETAIDQLPPE